MKGDKKRCDCVKLGVRSKRRTLQTARDKLHSALDANGLDVDLRAVWSHARLDNLLIKAAGVYFTESASLCIQFAGEGRILVGVRERRGVDHQDVSAFGLDFQHIERLVWIGVRCAGSAVKEPVNPLARFDQSRPRLNLRAFGLGINRGLARQLRGE